jgi:hypothetical protein
MFAIQAPGLSELIGRFARQPAEQHRRMVTVMHDATGMVRNQARANIARLFNTPDRMQDTLDATVVDGTWMVTGTVTAAGLPYLRIQEYGGVIQTPEIFPQAAQALHWLATAATGFSGAGASPEGVFAMHTAAHQTRLPERSYLRSALAQRRAEIIAAFQGTVAFSP